MKYNIYDIRGGLLDDDKVIEANSPIEAVRKLYNNVKRVKNGGDITVRVGRKVYCYYGERKGMEA